MVKKGFPSVHFYDQDFVDIYERSWAWIQDFWSKGTSKNGFGPRYFNYPHSSSINQLETILSTFYLVYSNRLYPAATQLDIFYGKQEPSGAIRSDYRESDGKPVFTEGNPDGINPPLFSFAEYNLYHKVGNKKRLKDIMPNLEKYFSWLESHFKGENGLYNVPVAATMMENAPRGSAVYLVDFNAQQAVNALYMSAIGDILNDKEISFKYKKQYFSLKTRINSLMWNNEDGFYYDLDKNQKQIRKRPSPRTGPSLRKYPTRTRRTPLSRN